ncbi:MAG: uncharacterized protein JWQ11_280, partial [Rhizobacter sp.]|nr:uncharacterized protein [Rhizobacter sp.]
MSVVSTTWHRLEPRVRGVDPSQGLRAAVHDPLWLLGRQWQVGELLGEDAAFPVAVRVETAEHPISRFRPGSPGAQAAASIDYDAATTPLEVMVEREPPAPQTLRARLDAWSRLRSMLELAGLATVAATLAAAHPLPPPRMADDAADASLRLLAGAGAADGLAIADTLRAAASGVPPAVVSAYLAWVDAQRPPGAGDCWITDRLEYRFTVGAQVDGQQVALTAPDYLGGRLDWFDMDLDASATTGLAATVPSAAPRVAHLLPTRVSFPGMPAERFWEFEDASVNLGAMTASADDLGRLLTVEFACVFGNDWWQVPVPAGFGSLVTVRSLVVRDTFGQNTLIEPTARAAAHRASAPWRMFTQSDAQLAAGAGPSPDLLLLAPVLGGAAGAGLDGDAIEELLLLRDEMANMAWAVERVVEGADGRPRNRSSEYRTALRAASSPERQSPAELVYLLQTQVPAHWIPLIPV